jgi:hypothetical protein
MNPLSGTIRAAWKSQASRFGRKRWSVEEVCKEKLSFRVLSCLNDLVMDSGFACCVGSQARLSTRAAGYNITPAHGAFYRGKFVLFFTFFFPTEICL